MPTISVFIRKDDLDKFKALPNKSEFLHNALNDDARINEPFSMDKALRFGVEILEKGGKLEEPALKNIKQNKDGTLRIDNPDKPFYASRIPELKFCKHGADPRLCKFAKKGICK